MTTIPKSFYGTTICLGYTESWFSSIKDLVNTIEPTKVLKALSTKNSLLTEIYNILTELDK